METLQKIGESNFYVKIKINAAHIFPINVDNCINRANLYKLLEKFCYNKYATSDNLDIVLTLNIDEWNNYLDVEQKNLSIDFLAENISELLAEPYKNNLYALKQAIENNFKEVV